MFILCLIFLKNRNLFKLNFNPPPLSLFDPFHSLFHLLFLPKELFYPPFLFPVLHFSLAFSFSLPFPSLTPIHLIPLALRLLFPLFLPVLFHFLLYVVH